jgi:sodium-dependent dicarboxylate transporter 2/3/5
LLWLFPAQRQLTDGSDSLKKKLQGLGVWSKAEKKAGIILGLLLLLWMTDFLHHVAPEVICIGVCFACFLPGIAALTGDDLMKLNMAPMLFTGAALSLGAVMSKTKANEVLARYMFAWLEPLLHSNFLTVIGLYWSCFIYHGFMPNAQSLLSTTLPPLLNFAAKNGMNAVPVTLIWTAASGPSIFLFQSGVIVLAHSYGQFRAKDFLKYGLLMAAIEFIVLALVLLLVWPFIGLSLRG